MPDSAIAQRPLPLEKAAPALALHVARVQNRMGRVALGTGLAMAFPIVVAWLAIEMPLDWRFDLPRWARALFFLTGLGSAGVVAWRIGVRYWLHRPDDDRIALAIERAIPEFRSRFIASIQLARRPDDHSRPLVRALLKETTERARNLELRKVVSTDRLRHWLIAALGTSIVGVGLCWNGGDATWPLFERAILFNTPRPTETRIVSFTGDRVIAIGDDLRLEAHVEGIIPETGTLRVQVGEAKPIEFTLDADPANPAHFLRGIAAVQQTFRYRIELGDAKTEWAQVRARTRPIIQSLILEQRWPEYTGLPPQRRGTGELKILAGSKLAAALNANVPLREATMQLLGPDRKVREFFAMQSSPAGAEPEWRGEALIPAKDVSSLTFQLTDPEGVQSSAMAAYRVDIVPDQTPTLAVLWPPRREELVTPKAILLVAFEVKDDFGIDRVKLHYAVNWAPGGPHKTLDMDLGEVGPKAITRRFEWHLSRLDPPLKEGDVIDFWLEVSDRNNVTGPGVATMKEHYQARVVSEEEKRADLATRLTDTLQGLNDLRQNQEDLARRLGDIIYEKKP